MSELQSDFLPFKAKLNKSDPRLSENGEAIRTKNGNSGAELLHVEEGIDFIHLKFT
jgi:hypothetical protein